MAQIFNSPYASTEVINVSGAMVKYATVPSGLTDPSKVASRGKQQSLPFGVQQVDLRVQRPVSQSFSLAKGQNDSIQRYLYLGQTTGTLTLSGLFGPASSIGDFAQSLADGCASLTFWITPGTNSGCKNANNPLGTSYSGQTLQVFGCILNSFNFQYTMGQGGIAVIKYPLSFQLAGLNILKNKK